MPQEAAYLSPELFKFLTELKRSNNREWFARNKTRYEKFYVNASVRFIKDVGPKLKTISPYLVGDKFFRRVFVPHLQRHTLLQGQEPVQNLVGNGLLARTT